MNELKEGSGFIITHTRTWENVLSCPMFCMLRWTHFLKFIDSSTWILFIWWNINNIYFCIISKKDRWFKHRRDNKFTDMYQILIDTNVIRYVSPTWLPVGINLELYLVFQFHLKINFEKIYRHWNNKSYTAHEIKS